MTAAGMVETDADVVATGHWHQCPSCHHSWTCVKDGCAAPASSVLVRVPKPCLACRPDRTASTHREA